MGEVEGEMIPYTMQQFLNAPLQ